MAFTTRESVVGIGVVALGNLLAIVLAFAVPPVHPARTSVDNSLLWLGVLGLLVAAALPGSGMVEERTPTRRALLIYAVLSLASVALADFGPQRRLGWVVKAGAVGLFALAAWRIRRDA